MRPKCCLCYLRFKTCAQKLDRVQVFVLFKTNVSCQLMSPQKSCLTYLGIYLTKLDLFHKFVELFMEVKKKGANF